MVYIGCCYGVMAFSGVDGGVSVTVVRRRRCVCVCVCVCVRVMNGADRSMGWGEGAVSIVITRHASLHY